jgi:hypothetical protein
MKILIIVVTFLISVLGIGILSKLSNYGFSKDISNSLEVIYSSIAEKGQSIIGKNLGRDTKHKLNDVNVFFDSFLDVKSLPSPSEIVIGYWELPERILICKNINGKYYLMQTDSQRSYYVPRGLNLLNIPETKITHKPDFKIESEDSGIGGLLKPSNFPEETFLGMGFIINDQEEYVKAINEVKQEPEVFKQEIAGLKSLDLTESEKKTIPKNSFDWSKFESLTIPKGHNMILGYGSPIYKTGLKKNKLPYFDSGWTHAINIETLPMKHWAVKKNGNWESKNNYYFQQYAHLIYKAAEQNYSKWDKNKWGDINGLWNGKDYGYDYSRITDEGAKALGRTIGANLSVALNNETGLWNVKTRNNYLIMDEEMYVHYPNYRSFMGKVAEGITETNPELNVMLYGPATSYFIHANNWTETIPDSKIEQQLKNGDFSFNNDGFLKSKTIFDLSMGYYKVPGIESNSKYKKVDGKYLIKNGKRVYATNNFYESYFGQKVEILGEPHEWLKYSLTLKNPEKRDDTKGIYKDLFGKQYFDESGKVKAQFQALYRSSGRPKSEWLPESELAVRQEYKFVNGVLMKMLIMNRVEFGDYNINIYRDRNLKFGVVRRWRTEPFTDYGNHIERREIGPELVFWDVAFSIVAGVTTLEAWEDGLYLNQLPASGKVLYGENDNYGRYEAATRAMQKVFKPFENLPVEKTKYLHFYMPFKGEKNAEAIVVARYNSGKMVLAARNPTLDPDEKQLLTLTLKGQKYEIGLRGNKTRLVELNVQNNLEAHEAILEQTNIYGQKIRTNGLSTWEIKSKYK